MKSKCNIIGRIDDRCMDFIKSVRPDIAEKIKSRNIIMWNERYEHIEKHRMNFSDIYDFDKYIELIPEIIKIPDYIGIKDKNNSIQFIKQFDDNILVAVRITTKGQLSFRTMYPITNSQLDDYISKNTAWKYNNT